MSEWEQATTDDGRVYYYNIRTQETSWEKPVAQEDANSNTKVNEWSVFTTDDGREYYYNERTQETTWSRPPEFESTTEVDKLEDGSSNKVERNEKSSFDRTLEAESVIESSIVKAQVFASPEEGEKAFQNMLKDHEIDSTWPFQKVMSTFISNPSYWAVASPLRRQQLYDEYLLSRIQEEAENTTKVVEKLEQNLIQELEKYKEAGKLNERTRWISIKDLLIRDDNPIFKLSVLSDNQVVRIFTGFRNKLQEAKLKLANEEKSQALFELKTYLVDMKPPYITSSKNWNELYESLTNDPRFRANKHFKVLSKADILELYQTTLYPEEVKKLKEQISIIDQQNKRRDRKARKQFSALLRTLEIKSNTTFQDIYPQIEDHDCFIELCGRKGSTPIELFWDILDEKEQAIKLQKDLVNNVLLDHMKKVSGISWKHLFSSYETFSSNLRKVQDERLHSIIGSNDADTTLREIYTGLRDDYLSQRQRQALIFQKRLDHVIHDCARQISATYLDNPLIVIEETEAGANDEKASEGSVENKLVIEKIKTSDSSLAYKVKPDSLTDNLIEQMAKLKELTALVTLCTDFHAEEEDDNVNGDNTNLQTTIQDAAKRVVVELALVISAHETSTKKRTRVSEEQEHDTTKKQKHEASGKPVLMNY